MHSTQPKNAWVRSTHLADPADRGCEPPSASSLHQSSQFGGEEGGGEGSIHAFAMPAHSAQAAHFSVHEQTCCQPSEWLAHQAPQQPVAMASAGDQHVTDCASLTEISTKTKSSSRRLEMGKRIPMRRGGWA